MSKIIQASTRYYFVKIFNRLGHYAISRQKKKIKNLYSMYKMFLFTNVYYNK